ncbi:glycosyltransferase family 9 protein [Ignavibacteria bacterium]|nr:glycosyltransferase family 9 protein [Bacteroidota bacterium]
MNFQNIIRRIAAGLFRIVFRNNSVNLPIAPESTRKILILRYDVMGDMVVTTPLISFLKAQLPQAEIHVVGSRRNIGILRCNPDISRIFRYDFSISSFFNITNKCRKENYDIIFAIVFNKTIKSAIWANLCGNKNSIKIVNKNYDREAIYKTMFNATIPLTNGIYSMAELLIQLAAKTFGLDYSPDYIRFSVIYDDNNARKAAKFTEKLEPDHTIFVNISTGKSETQWPTANWIALFGMLHKNFPKLHFIISGIKADENSIKQIADQYPDFCLGFPPSGDILDATALMDCCIMTITPDTAMVHIAAALGKPVLGLYTPLHKGTEYLPFYEPNRVVFSPDTQPVSGIGADAAAKGFADLWREIQKKRQ